MRRRPTFVLAALALSAIVLGLADSTVSNLAVAQGTATPPSHSRMFYLTKEVFNGAQVLQACAKGYHLASVWEIYEAWNLVYNPQLGFRYAPYQFGPPIDGWPETAGWVERGNDPALSFDSCNGWTSDLAFIVGNTMSPTSTPNWDMRQANCSESHRVWCVSNP